MTALQDTVLVLLVLSSFALLGASRLGACIRFVALQGIVTGLLPIAVSGHGPTPRVAVIGATVILIKGFFFPHLLTRAMREAQTRRELQPFVGYVTSLAFGVLALIGSFWLDSRLNLPIHGASDLVVPVALATMIIGLFLIVSRRIAVSQVIGFLVLENGIYAFGVAIVRDVPALIELGILMDVFVAVFVMGIAIYHINREFDHIDTDRLTMLKG
ncbi:MAG: hydrogenase [Verrucomicrobia bacterium]|nr:hydrogenase [Verrucomicrobiota bacterium]